MKKCEGEKEKKNSIPFILVSFQTPTSCQYNEVQREICYFDPCISHIRPLSDVSTRSKQHNLALVSLLINGRKSSCFYRASVKIKTHYYSTDAQIYNSWIQLEIL